MTDNKPLTVDDIAIIARTMPEVGIKRVSSPPHSDIIPRYETDFAAGGDLRMGWGLPTIVLAPGQRFRVPSGIAVSIPPGWEGQVRSRSGLASKHGICVVNSPGTVDSDYRGEILVALINHGEEPYIITSGDRIAQLVIKPVWRANFIEVEELDETDRGTGGFGSTGSN